MSKQLRVPTNPATRPADFKDDTNAQHTPGPWTLTELIPGKNGITLSSETRYITGPDKENITSVYGKGNAANARLIAAAPELLTALKEIVDKCPREFDDNEWAEYTENQREAIAKAEGK